MNLIIPSEQDRLESFQTCINQVVQQCLLIVILCGSNQYLLLSPPSNQSVFFTFSQLGTFSGTSYIDLRWLGPDSGNQRLRLQYSVSGSTNRLSILTDVGTIPADGTWKHIVVTFDGEIMVW